MELTLHNIFPLEGDNIAVHFLTSKDGYLYGLAFKQSDVSEVLWYTSKDNRGPLSIFLPPRICKLEDNDISMLNKEWDTRGVILKQKHVDQTLWTQSTYVFTISSDIYLSYQQWLIEWISYGSKYSLFEIGNSSRVFMSNSLDYFRDRSTVLSLLNQEVTTLTLEYSHKDELSTIATHEAIEWFNILLNINTTNVKDVITIINESGTMYYREYVNNVQKYWKITGARIKDNTQQLSTTTSSKVAAASVASTPSLQDTIIVSVPNNALFTTNNPPLDPITQPISTLTIVLLAFLVIFIILIIMYIWYLSDKRRRIEQESLVATTMTPVPVHGSVPSAVIIHS